MTPISRATLLTDFNKMCGPSPNRQDGVKYKLGAKVDYGIWRIKGGLAGDTNDVRRIDCSGWTRYGAAKASNQGLIIPDGSVNQHEWCEKQGLTAVSYRTAGTADPDRLFIAFIPPVGPEPGHVFFVMDGQTLESHGGDGIDSRPWTTPVLLNGVASCYELPSIP